MDGLKLNSNLTPPPLLLLDSSSKITGQEFGQDDVNKIAKHRGLESRLPIWSEIELRLTRWTLPRFRRHGKTQKLPKPETKRRKDPTKNDTHSNSKCKTRTRHRQQGARTGQACRSLELLTHESLFPVTLRGHESSRKSFPYNDPIQIISSICFVWGFEARSFFQGGFTACSRFTTPD